MGQKFSTQNTNDGKRRRISMENTSRIKLVKNLNTTELAGEKVMIDFESGKYFMLKGAANEIWEIIQNEVTFEEIIKKLRSEFDVSEDECREATEAFLNKLLGYEFITVI